MKIVIVGPGAMGTLFAGLLSTNGNQVGLLGRRPEVVQAIARQGITIVRDGSERKARVDATLDARDFDAPELVIIYVKAYDTLQASKDVLPAVGPGTVVLTLQNGFGNVDAIASVLGRERVIAGVTGHGATRLGPGVVRHAGAGVTTIGELDGRDTDRLAKVAATLRQSGISVEFSRGVDSLIWGKLIVNAAINPLTALLRVRNGELLERADARALMATVVREAAAVARAREVELPYADPLERTETICRLTASNRSSMLQDVERETRTEIDHINGAIVREGESAGVPTPVNLTLTQLVRALKQA